VKFSFSILQIWEKYKLNHSIPDPPQFVSFSVMRNFPLIYRTILLLSLLAPALQSPAQSPYSAHWYFGKGAGLDFSAGIPVADTNSAIHTIEGGCSISDSAGNLLFYSDAMKVWNSDHAVMPNGTGLQGSQTAINSCLIVPFPAHPSLYYIFTNGYNAEYSIVDMSLDSGRGDVIAASKNTFLFPSAGEDLGGTLHCNAEDYWIVMRQGNSQTSSTYHSYLLDSSGLSAPLDYTLNRATTSVGHLVFSQDGNYLSASMQTQTNYVFGFDRQTGAMTLQDSMKMGNANGDWFYCTAFSPDNSKIYSIFYDNSAYVFVSQFDRNAPNLNASRLDLDSIYFFGSTTGYGWIGKMQLGSDQRIYIARWGMPGVWCPNTAGGYCFDSLDVIHYPDSAGFACYHQRAAVLLGGKATMIGLPSFVSQFTAPGTPQYSCNTAVVKENRPANSFTLFPNPFSGGTEIRLDRYEGNTEFEVYNSAGMLVRKQIIESAHFYFDAEGLENGIYFFRIQLASGVLTGKLVIMN
jgi:hypothetical protein